MSAPLPFTKMQGIGNDFVVLDEAEWPPDSDWPTQARALCDRRFGVGADGLIVVGPSPIADIRMRYFNADGSEDMCGNGLRCTIRFAAARGLVPIGRGSVETLAGIRHYETRGDAQSISVGMGKPQFAPADLPMNVPVERVLNYPLDVDGEKISISAVSIGTPHTIIYVNELPDDARFLGLSPRIENHPLFPEQTSVMWTIVDGPDCLRLRIWERGVGETLGCGTGACAAAVAAIMTRRLLPLPDWRVSVASKGGELIVHWQGLESDEVALTGPAEIVYTGVWEGT